MFRGVINVIPFSLLIILLMIMFMLIAYFAAHLSDFFFNKEDKLDRSIANSLMSIVTSGFFVLLAFIIINTWNYMQDARSGVSKESDYLALIAYNISSFSPESQGKIKDALAQYTVAVRVDEWSTMREGKTSPVAWNALNNLYLAIQNFQPASAHESQYYSLITTNMNKLIELRRERVNRLQSMIPKSLSYSILGGCIFLAFILGVTRGKDTIFSLAPILLFASLLGFNLALALSFDYPFSGDISVSNRFFYVGILDTFPDKNPIVSAPNS